MSRDETEVPPRAPESGGPLLAQCARLPSEYPTVACHHSPSVCPHAALAAACNCPTTIDSRADRGDRGAEPQTLQSTAHLLQPLLGWLSHAEMPPRPISSISRTALPCSCGSSHHWLAACQGVNATAPSVQRHYSAFAPTTSCSAPVLRIGTQSLARIARSTHSLHIEATGSH